MTVQHLDYERLRSLTDVQTGFQRGVAGAIASRAGHGTKVDEIQVKVAPGSVRVDARITNLTGAEAMSLQSELVSSKASLRTRLTSSISDVAGINQACTGTVTVIDLQARAEAVTASPTGSSRAQAAAWLFGIAATCFCPLLGLLVWQHRARDHSSKDSQPGPLGANGISNTEPSHDTPLVDPANTNSQGETEQQVQQQAGAGADGISNTEPSHDTPLVDPANTNGQQASEQQVQQQAGAGTKAETKADQTEQKENEEPQQPSPPLSQQPSQQLGEQGKDEGKGTSEKGH